MLYTILHRIGSSVPGETDLPAAVHAVVPLDTLPMVHISIDVFAKPYLLRISSSDTQEHVGIDNAMY